MPESTKPQLRTGLRVQAHKALVTHGITVSASLPFTFTGREREVQKDRIPHHKQVSHSSLQMNTLQQKLCSCSQCGDQTPLPNTL